MRARANAIVRSDLDGEIENFLECLSDEDPFPVDQYKGLVREVFGRLERSPLEFPYAHQGCDVLGGSLVIIQRRNRARFDLLRDDLSRSIQAAEESRLWSDYREYLESACSVFEQARETLLAHRRVALQGCGDLQWTKAIQLAVRTLPGSRRAVFQYANKDFLVVQAARKFWLKPKPGSVSRLEDPDVYALLAMDTARRMAESIRDLMGSFDSQAEQADITANDDEAFDRLRNKAAAEERGCAKYSMGLLRQAESLLSMAQLARVKTGAADADRYLQERDATLQQREEENSRLAKKLVPFEKGRMKGGESRRDRIFSPFKHAILSLCGHLCTYDPAVILDAIRAEADAYEYGEHGHSSETMDDLRGRRNDPVRLRFQSAPENLRDKNSLIHFMDEATGKEESCKVSYLRNLVSEAKNKAERSRQQKN
jgi:hypothetical protein